MDSKKEHLKKLVNEKGIITALALDQRGSLKKMLSTETKEATDEDLKEFKKLVVEELSSLGSGLLIDLEYGEEAIFYKDSKVGLLLTYEKTGYDASQKGRFPDVIENLSVKRLKEKGANAVKILLYYDPDDNAEINERKKAFIERIGSECKAEGIPFFLEPISYDDNIKDAGSYEFALVKPRKVIESTREFSKERYGVDVLKVEVPVNMKFVEGYGEKVAYTQEEALKYFKEQSDVCEIPFIYLSAGVSSEVFQETIKFASKSGAKFNGVLCGRATWAEATKIYAKEGREATINWLRTKGKENMEKLNEILNDGATPLF